MDEVARLVDEGREVLGPGPLSVRKLDHTLVASATRGLWRVATPDGARSVVVKVLADVDAPQGSWPTGSTPDHWGYWRREARFYESDLLAGPGLRAPRCHRVVERADGSVALWLEDLRGTPGPAWPVARYRDAARDLGRWQGRAIGVPRDEPWFSREWLRAYLTGRDRALAVDRPLLADPHLWRHPLLAAWFPEPPVDELEALIDDRDRHLAVLDALPRTVAHLDLHPANLFAEPDADAEAVATAGTVVVDWAYVGVGAVGEDPGNLVPDAAFDFHVDPADLPELGELVASGYHAGLRDARADLSLDDVRRAMSAATAAKYAWIAPAMLRAVAEDRPLLNRRPLAEGVAAWAPTVRYLLTRARSSLAA